MQQPSDPQARSPQRYRPLGVALLAILVAMGGLFDLLAGATLLGAGAAIAASTFMTGGVATLVALGLLVLALLLLALAYGLWLLRPWAWSLGVGLEIANILVAVLRLAGQRETVYGVLLTFVIAGTVLYYLYQPAVRAAFRQA